MLSNSGRRTANTTVLYFKSPRNYNCGRLKLLLKESMSVERDKFVSGSGFVSRSIGYADMAWTIILFSVFQVRSGGKLATSYLSVLCKNLTENMKAILFLILQNNFGALLLSKGHGVYEFNGRNQWMLESPFHTHICPEFFKCLWVCIECSRHILQSVNLSSAPTAM
jgi:hypothetical protein